MKLTNILRKAVLREKESSTSFINFLRDRGATIGNDVHIYSPNKTYIDEQFPWMLTIGDHVHITLGCHILNHDYSWAIGKSLFGEVIGGVGQVVIGNNVFIGVNSVILMNTNIGDNVIIGAGSVVKGNIPSNSVVGGNPAKVICTLEEYWERRKSKQYAEASLVVKRYRERFGVNPTEDKLPAYFFLWKKRSDALEEWAIQRMKLCHNYEESMDVFSQSQAMFGGFQDFLDSIE